MSDKKSAYYPQQGWLSSTINVIGVCVYAYSQQPNLANVTTNGFLLRCALSYVGLRLDCCPSKFPV